MLRTHHRNRALWIVGLLAVMAMLSSATISLASDASTDEIQIDIDGRSATLTYGDTVQAISTSSSPCHVPNDELDGPVLNLSASTYDWHGDGVSGFVGIKDSTLGVNRTGRGNSHWCKKIDYLGHDRSEALDISLADVPAIDGKQIETAELRLKLWSSAKVKVEFFNGSTKVGEDVTYLRSGYRTIEASPGILFDHLRLSSKFGSFGLRSSTLHLQGTAASADLSVAVGGSGYYFAEGDDVPLTYTILNTGDQVLTDYSITDAASSGVSCPTAPINPGDSVDCTGTVENVDGAGQQNRTASLSATGQFGDPADAEGSYSYFVATPGLSITVATSDGDQTGDGVVVPATADLTWIYTLTNSGNVDLDNVVVADTGQGVLGGPDVPNNCPETIAAFTEVTCEASGTARTSVPGVFFENTATVNATAPAGTVPEGSDSSSYFGFVTSLTIEAISPDGEIVTEGDPVTYTFLITNGGNLPLSVNVTEQPGDVSPHASCNNIVVAAYDTDMSCSFTRTAELGVQGSTFTATGDNDALDDVVVVVTAQPVQYVGGLACGAAADEGDPGANDVPYIYFANGPASTNPESSELPNSCNTPVSLSVSGPDGTYLGTASAVPVENQEFGPATGIITVEWDGVLPGDLSGQVTKELILNVEFDIPACGGDTTVMTTPIVLTGGQVVYELANSIAQYPSAVPSGRNVCKVMSIEANIIEGGVQKKQVTEVFYFNNDPRFVRS